MQVPESLGIILIVYKLVRSFKTQNESTGKLRAFCNNQGLSRNWLIHSELTIPVHLSGQVIG